MFGLSEEVDLSFLDGKTFQQVCIGENEIRFNFDESVSISIESRFQITVNRDVVVFDDARPAASAAVSLLGERVESTLVAPGGTLVLELSGGKRIEIFDSSDFYESYQIEHNGVTIVV